MSTALSRTSCWTLGRDRRMQVYVAGYSAPKANVGVLEQLLGTRHEMAAMLGAPSWAHYQARSQSHLIMTKLGGSTVQPP